MQFNDVISTIGLVGLGGMLQSCLGYLLSKKEVANKSHHEFKNLRYKSVILLANALLDFEKRQDDLKKHGRNFTIKDQLVDELIVERDNMILFASDKVILLLSSYIKTQTEESFYKVAIAMRRDLYGLKTKLSFSNIATFVNDCH